MVSLVSDNIEFFNDLLSDDQFQFEAKLVSNYFRNFPASFRDKISIYEYLKQNILQNYLIPDRDIPIKVVIRGLPRSSVLELINETLAYALAS